MSNDDLNPTELNVEIPDEDDDESDLSPGYKMYLKGNVALEQNDKYTALAYFLLSKDLESHYKPLEKIAEILKTLNYVEESYPYIREAYSVQPTSDKTAVLYAEALVEQENYESAKEVLNSVLQRNPTYKPAKKLLGSI